MADDGTRPPLGFEYELSLALVNVDAGVTFDETPYPPIVGSFEVIFCTKTASCEPPVSLSKNIPCGYNPAAHKIPSGTRPGRLDFTGLDKAKADPVLPYCGFLCVACLKASVDNELVRTIYCNYYVPELVYHTPEGEGEGTISVQGEFTQLTSAKP